MRDPAGAQAVGRAPPGLHSNAPEGEHHHMTRRLGGVLIPGIVLHGAFYFSLSVFAFSTTMWTLYVAFIEPDEMEKWLLNSLPLGPEIWEKHQPPSPTIQ